MKAPVLILPVLAACSTYAEHRAALVPHATPIAGDGQPMTSTGQLSLGASNLADFRAPTAGDPDAGIAIPSTQLRGELAFRPTKNFSFGVVHEHGLASTATAIHDSQPPLTDDDVTGNGIIMAYSIETGTPGFRVGIATELLVWDAPWVQYTSCVANCGTPGYTVESNGHSSVGTAALGVVPSYRYGRFTVFGGLTVRNQPTLSEKTYTNVPADPEVQGGPANWILHAGADVDIAYGIRASVFVHHDLSADPVNYGPAIGAMLTLPLFGNQPSQPSAPSI
jgi:hypothetical protein